jgi:tetratricopeptide (TPR) repeat protein
MNDKSELQKLRSSKNPDDRRKCISLLTQVLSSEPTNGEAWFDVASCHDFLGEELLAEPAYEKALQIGAGQLPIEKRPRLFVQYGSTLRNNSKAQKALEIFEQGIKLYPEYAALKAFKALTLFRVGRFKESSQSMAQAIIQSRQNGWDGYDKAITYYYRTDVVQAE